MENRREGKSYSVDTVERLLSEHPDDLEIYFILGQDAFRMIQTWKDWERLMMLCNFVVMERPGCKEERLAHILPPDFARRFIYNDNLKGYQCPDSRLIFFRQVSLLDISSSHIRERIKVGQSARYLLPDSVLSYIDEQGCYQ
jgi:nicotinate-nucleotide adenylyltransferase